MKMLVCLQWHTVEVSIFPLISLHQHLRGTVVGEAVALIQLIPRDSESIPIVALVSDILSPLLFIGAHIELQAVRLKGPC